MTYSHCIILAQHFVLFRFFFLESLKDVPSILDENCSSVCGPPGKKQKKAYDGDLSAYLYLTILITITHARGTVFLSLFHSHSLYSILFFFLYFILFFIFQHTYIHTVFISIYLFSLFCQENLRPTEEPFLLETHVRTCEKQS